MTKAALPLSKGNLKATSSEDEATSYNKEKVFNYIQKIDPLKQNLIKSYYTLRLLKSR